MSDTKSVVVEGRLVATAVFFVSEWLDKDQVRVSETAPNEFRIKAGRQLTDYEVRGAIVKFKLNQREAQCVEKQSHMDSEMSLQKVKSRKPLTDPSRLLPRLRPALLKSES